MTSKYMQIMFGILFALKLLGKIGASWAVVLAPFLIDAACHVIIASIINSVEHEYNAEEGMHD